MEGPFIWKVTIWSLHISCRTGPKWCSGPSVRKKWSGHNVKTAKTTSKSSNNVKNYSWLLFMVSHDLEYLQNRMCTGQEYVDNLLKCGSHFRIKNQLRMKLNTFNLLRDWLVQNAGLKASWYTTIEEKLLLFIYISSKGMSNCAVQEQFNRGAHTISS
jgi:hypothetical protein